MKRPINIKAALFDLDGVIVNTEPLYTIFWDQIGKDYRGEDNFAAKTKGATLVATLETFFSGREDVHKEIVRRIDKFEAEMDFIDVPGIVPFLASLKNKGIKVAVVTSSNKPKMASFFKSRSDLLPYFDKVMTSEDFAESKPSPDCYQRAAAAFGFDKSECVVFEDSLNGLSSGRAAGMYLVGLATTLPIETVKPLCDEVIEDFVNFSL